MSLDYKQYLASREWSLKREAVRERSHDHCERCFAGPQDSVHHLTYANVGDEPLEDLMAICNPCHEFLSGKSDQDPKRNLVALVVLVDRHGPCNWMAQLHDERARLIGQIPTMDGLKHVSQLRHNPWGEEPLEKLRE